MNDLERFVPDSFYHIYNRGNNRENLFVEERNYEFFLRQYQKYITPVADTFAYCLLRNHFHFLIRVKSCEVSVGPPGEPHRTQPNPSRQFSHLFNSYAKSMNSTYGRTGSLFQERFRRKEITGVDSLSAVVHYIHINPLKHRFVGIFEATDTRLILCYCQIGQPSCIATRCSDGSAEGRRLRLTTMVFRRPLIQSFAFNPVFP